MTFPGAPCFTYGDEIGRTRVDNEESRLPMPWGDDRLWNQEFLSWYRTLIHMRDRTPALHHGGFRWVHADDDQVVWLRETMQQRVLVRAARASGSAITMDPALLAGREITPLMGNHTSLTLPGDDPRFDVWELS